MKPFCRSMKTWLLAAAILLAQADLSGRPASALSGGAPQAGINSRPFAVGESIHYDVRWKALRVGKAEIQFLGMTHLGQRDYYLIRSAMKTPGYKGEDYILAAEGTWLPHLVKRKMRVFGTPKTIVEKYNQSGGSVEIIENAKGIRQVHRIEKTGHIENVILFIYRMRLTGNAGAFAKKNISFPTKDVAVSSGGIIDRFKRRGFPEAKVYKTQEGDFEVNIGLDPERTPLFVKNSLKKFSTMTLSYRRRTILDPDRIREYFNVDWEAV